MRIGALDISKNRIGIAFSDEDNGFVSFEKTLFTKNKKLFQEEFIKIFKEYKPEFTIIGLPYYNKNSESYDFVKLFAHSSRSIIGKFEFVDEAYTTFMARYHLAENNIVNSKNLDSIVARLIVLNRIQQINSK